MTSDSEKDKSDQAFKDAVVSAEAAVAGLSDQYIGWVNDDLKRLDAAVATVTDGDNPEALRDVYNVSHDIKGQGSTFGYPLVTAISQLLCRYAEEAIQRHKVDPAVIGAHVTALRTVVDNRIQGPAGELGDEIVAALKGAAEKSFV